MDELSYDAQTLNLVLGMLIHALGLAEEGEEFEGSAQEITEAAVDTIWRYRDLADDNDPLEYRG